MNEKIIVMQKGGVSYVKLSSYGMSAYLINGIEPVVAPGNSNFAMVDGEITRIERKKTATRSIIGYALYDRYKEITQLPHGMPAGAFTRDEDGDLCGENAEFYRAVFDNPQPTLDPVDFEIVDRDCAPVAIPHYVTIDFPNNIARYPETQHKYPCRIGAETVFNMLWDRVKERVDASAGHYTMDSYKSIQTLTVNERIEIPFHQTRQVEYYPTQRSRNTKTRTEVVKTRTVKVFEVCGPKYSNSGGKACVQSIRGENYAELQANLEAYIQTFLAELTEGRRQLCEKCRGEGVLCV